MRVLPGMLLAVLFTTAAASGAAAQQLRDDSYRWYIAPQGGMLLFETPSQTRSALPVVGAQVMVLGKRGGLIASVEEALGDDEASAFAEAGAAGGARSVTFDRLRKYSATLMAYPIQARVEPYLGVGYGLLHTVGTQVGGIFTDPAVAAAAGKAATERGSTGFASFTGGVQARLTPRAVLFGQYQITTAPTAGKLLLGPTHTLVAGVRLGLGTAKEGIRGGGY